MKSKYTVVNTIWGALIGATTWVISSNVSSLFFFTSVFGGAPGRLARETPDVLFFGALLGALAGFVGSRILQKMDSRPVPLILAWAVIGAIIGAMGIFVGGGGGLFTGAILGGIGGVVGGGLMATPASEGYGSDVIKSPDWLFLPLWVLAGALGWLISLAIALPLGLLSYYDSIMESFFKDLVFHALTGTLIGVLQWLILRRYVRRCRGWILAWPAGAMIGGVFMAVLNPNQLIMYTLGSSGEMLVNVILSGLFGAGVGIVQWFVLRRKVRGAALWIPGAIVAVVISDIIRDALFSSSWYMSHTSIYMAVVSSGALTELIVGVLLIWLVCRSTPIRSGGLWQGLRQVLGMVFSWWKKGPIARVAMIGGLLGICALAAVLITGRSSDYIGRVFPIPSTGTPGESDLLVYSAPNRSSPIDQLDYLVKENDSWSTLWQYSLEDDIVRSRSWGVFDQSYIYLVGDRLVAVDRKNGSEAWDVSLADAEAIQPGCADCVKLVQDRVVVLTHESQMLGFDTHDGHLAWQVVVPPHSAESSRFFVVDGQIVVINGSPETYKFTQDASVLDQINSDERWELAVHVFDPVDGTLEWRIIPDCTAEDELPWSYSEENVISMQTSSGDTRAIFFMYECIVVEDPPWAEANTPRYVQNWDLASGEMMWLKSVPKEALYRVESWVISHDALYFGTYNALFEVSFADGEFRKLADLDPEHYFQLLAYHDDILVIRDCDATMCELWGVGASGEHLWQYDLLVEEPVEGRVVAMSDYNYRYTSHGIILLEGFRRGKDLSIVMLDPQTGTVVRESDINLEDFGFITGDDSYIYLVEDGNLYAIALDTLIEFQIE